MSNIPEENIQTDAHFRTSIDNIERIPKIYDHKNITIENVYPGDIISIFEETNEDTKFKPIIRCLVVEKGNDYIKGFKCNIKEEDIKDSISSFYFHSPKYSRENGTWVNLNEFIQITNPSIKSILIRLDYLDLGFIEKRLQILSKLNPDFNYSFNTKTYMEIGDLISYDDTLFYIYKIAGSTVDAYRVIDENCKFIPRNFRKIHIDSKNYYINYLDEFHLKSNDNISYIDIAYPDEIKFIEENIKKAKENYTLITCASREEIPTDSYVKDYITSTEELVEERRVEQRCGQIYKYKGKTAIFLFRQKKNIYVGVILEEYKKTNKLINISHLPIRKSLGVLDINEVYKIVDYLSNNSKMESNIIRMFLSHLDKRFNEVEQSKELLKRLKDNSENECIGKDISTLSFGDIVEIDLKRLEKDNIANNYNEHTTYFVSYIKDNTAYCFQTLISPSALTSSLKSDLVIQNEIVQNINSTIILNFNTLYEIPTKYILGNIYTFSDDKISFIKKNFLSIAKRIKKHNDLCFAISNELGFHKGDIIENITGQKYLFIKKDKDVIITYKLYKKMAKDRIEIRVNNAKEFVEIKSNVIDALENYRLIYTLTKEDIEKIESFDNTHTPQLNLEYSKLNLSSLSTGDIITSYKDINTIYLVNNVRTYELSLYYIISQDEEKYYCFKCDIDTRNEIGDSPTYSNFKVNFMGDELYFVVKFSELIEIEKKYVLGGVYSFNENQIVNILKKSNAYYARQNTKNLLEKLNLDLPPLQKGDVIFRVSKDALNSPFNEGKNILTTESFYIIEANNDHIYALRLKRSRSEEGFFYPCKIRAKTFFLNIEKIELTFTGNNDFSYFCEATQEENQYIENILKNPPEYTAVYNDDKI